MECYGSLYSRFTENSSTKYNLDLVTAQKVRYVKGGNRPEDDVEVGILIVS
jgi:hypothetical protein